MRHDNLIFQGVTAIKPFENNPQFSNPLVNSASPYLRQHAHNPVFWYPWGKEAIEKARAENKPILLSIGYSTCYWCHVMEREVFENVSIASLMNRHFINIKVDREEHPELDDIYMTARQMLTHEGGWPNNVFLTPELKPFYAGGTYAPDESYGKPAFPRLLEWLHFSWSTKPEEAKQAAQQIFESMQNYLVHPTTESTQRDMPTLAGALLNDLKNHHDERSGGFFQAPKFPHETYLSYLLTHYEHTGDIVALDMAAHSLGKMAVGGIYDHVGCGFHRYAVDKEWYIPHFEKMLYNQAMLARVYTDAARLTGNAWFADIAKSILDFTAGPMRSGTGGFYAAIDAETDGVEGAYYAWTSQEIEALLTQDETAFFVAVYALADIPAFPGHKHAQGQAIIARKPLDLAAREMGMPYEQMAAMTGAVMNKLLAVRNGRKPPNLDDKIIVGWNGLMIDAFAHAGSVFSIERYTTIAADAANYLLEHAIDNEGRLKRISGQTRIDATLEDYAYLCKGLLSLWRTTGQKNWMESAQSLMDAAEELFADKNAPGYFYTQPSAYTLLQIKSGDDSTLPNANAVMLENMVALSAANKNTAYKKKAQAMADYFLGDSPKMLVEYAAMMEAALKLESASTGKKLATEKKFAAQESPVAPDDIVAVSASLFPSDAKPGERCELIVTLAVKEGWHINASKPAQAFLIPTQVTVSGQGVESAGTIYPEPLRRSDPYQDNPLLVYEGEIHVTARLRLLPKAGERPPLKLMVRFQPCSGATCHKTRDISLTV
jgi:uncharacterized protein YyaL (SSP411 family)